MRKQSLPHRDAAGPSALAIALSTETRGAPRFLRAIVGALLLSFLLAALAVGAARAEASAPNIGIPVTPTTVAPGGAPTTATTVTGATPTTAAASGTATPTTAQGAVATAPLNPGLRFPQGTVQFRPEYDSHDVLVIIDYELSPDMTTPFTLQFRVPSNALMTGYALVDAGGAFNYDRPVPTVTHGQEWDIVSVVVPKNKPIHIEYYYDPGLGLSGQRDFPITFDPPAALDRLTLGVQEPRRATGFIVSPGFGQTTQTSEGFTFHAESRSGVQPGQPITAKVSYGKPDAEPSLPPAGGVGSASGGASSAGTPAAGAGSAGNGYLVWLFLAAAVAVIGIVAYRLPARRPVASTTRSAQAPGRTRGTPSPVPPSRPSRSGAALRTSTSRPPRTSEVPAAGAQLFCTQCGGPFTPADRFCRQCGQDCEEM